MSGRLTADDILTSVLAARADPRWSDTHDYLTVMTEASLADISAEDAAHLIRSFAEYDPAAAVKRPKRAAIVCSDEMATGFLAYYEYRSKIERKADVRYFQSEAEARAWLASEPGTDEAEQPSS